MVGTRLALRGQKLGTWEDRQAKGLLIARWQWNGWDASAEKAAGREERTPPGFPQTRRKAARGYRRIFPPFFFDWSIGFELYCEVFLLSIVSRRVKVKPTLTIGYCSQKFRRLVNIRLSINLAYW